MIAQGLEVRQKDPPPSFADPGAFKPFPRPPKRAELFIPVGGGPAASRRARRLPAALRQHQSTGHEPRHEGKGPRREDGETAAAAAVSGPLCRRRPGLPAPAARSRAAGGRKQPPGVQLPPFTNLGPCRHRIGMASSWNVIPHPNKPSSVVDHPEKRLQTMQPVAQCQ